MSNSHKNLFTLVIFGLPGAIIRWIFLKPFNKEKTFKDFLADNVYLNALVGFIAVIMVILLTYTIS